MASSKLDSMWNLMSQNTFVVPPESANDDLTCVICKKLLADAFVSDVCGCRYCQKCIREYINNEEKCCPGGKEFCLDEFMVLYGNVTRHSILNKKVSKLKVNCLNKYCVCKIKLIDMNEHLRLCKKQAMNCPYVAIGCNSDTVDRETIESHMQSEKLTHSVLLIELIRNLKDEVSVLRDESEKRRNEIFDLKEESRINKDKITMLEEDLRIVRNEMQHRVNEEIRMKEDERTERDAMETMVTNLRKDMDDSFCQSKLEIISLNEESRIKDERIASLEEELSVVRKEGEIRMNEILVTMEREMSNQRRKRENVKMKVETVETLGTDTTKECRNTCDDDGDDGFDQCSQLCPNIVGDFLWKIEELSTKRNKWWYSESFYSNNYKLCLRLWIIEDISVYCCIMKGDNDDMVEWPMRRALTVSIVDQVTLKAHNSVTYKYDSYTYDKSVFDRPKKDKNYIEPWIIKYSSMKNNSSTIIKDSIIISCAVSDQ